MGLAQAAQGLKQPRRGLVEEKAGKYAPSAQKPVNEAYNAPQGSAKETYRERGTSPALFFTGNMSNYENKRNKCLTTARHGRKIALLVINKHNYQYIIQHTQQTIRGSGYAGFDNYRKHSPGKWGTQRRAF